jgi:hypothetical protein
MMHVDARLTLWAALTLMSSLLMPAEARSADDEVMFEKEIRPLFVQTCFKCHGGDSTSAGLRIDSLAALLAGGDSGPAIIPGDSAGSLLIQAVRRHEDVSAMPPDRPLPASQIEHLARWVDEGALWPRAPMDDPFSHQRHWAFQPLTLPALPTVQTADENRVDSFLRPAMEKLSLTPSIRADRRQRIRRAYYDLTGLPPSFEEVVSFAEDARPDAWPRCIDSLLASPAYGERWGRHWLDLARYADTAGENTDRPLPQAWKYRNWVIQAFNEDMPYSRFVQDQIAGDIIARNHPDENYANHVIATGYLAIARRFDHDIEKHMHLTFEDVLDTTGKSIMGLTIGCARCHSHKYDPISTSDYYALYGILASTRFPFSGCEPKPRPRDLVVLIPPNQIDTVLKPYRNRLANLDSRIQELQRFESEASARLSEKIASFSDATRVSGIAPDATVDRNHVERVSCESLHVSVGDLILLSVGPRENHGADSTAVEFTIKAIGEEKKWNLPGDVVDHFSDSNPTRDESNRPVWCYLDERQGWKLLADHLDGLDGHKGLSVWKSGELPSVFVNATDQPIKAWTELSPRKLFVHPAPDGPAIIAWCSPIEGNVKITGSIRDAHPGGDGVDWSMRHVAGDLTADLITMSDSRQSLTDLRQQRDQCERESPENDVAFAVAESTPVDAPIQERGDPEKPGAPVPRRWLEMFGGGKVSAEGSGRLELAKWLTDEANPLTYRVIVNRIWLQHFGAGLVATPNDFGTRGAAPTHPEMLDWLAREFITHEGSIKQMHRLLMESSAYQRSSLVEGDSAKRGASVDPRATTYWRFHRRRLSAEEIRDSILLAAGELDRAMGGAHPFPSPETWSYTQHSPFAADYEHRLRTVYLMVKRNQRDRFLALFDGADPNASTPVRSNTTVPTQSLYFMNDEHLHHAATELARRTERIIDSERTAEMFRIAIQRQPEPPEIQLLDLFQLAVVRETSIEEGWVAVARLLLTTNEFLYVD